MPISEADYQHWRQHGYVIVPLLDEDQLAAALEDIHTYMPPWEEYIRHPEWFHDLVRKTHGTYQTFPFVGDGLNASTLHPDLISFAVRVLRTDRIMLSHGQLGGNYPGTGIKDQQLHSDHGNNMLVSPRPDDETFDFPVIIYYTDVTIDTSPTYVVSQEHTRGPSEPRFYSPEAYPEMYEREIPVLVPAGSAVIYSMNTYHRGSAFSGSEGLRFAQNIAFKRVDTPWSGQVTFQHDGGSPEMNHFLENATPRLREFVGFPPVGDPYWDEGTIANVGLRYPGMDMTPYRHDATR